MPLRSTTSARPRAASPGVPVSDVAMASPTTTKSCSVCATAALGSATVEAAIQILPERIADLAKGVHRNRLEPGLRIIRFVLPDLAWRIDGACDICLDLGELAVFGLIKTGQ